MAVEQKSAWIVKRVRADEELVGYECAKCGLVVAGAPVTQQPARCPVCIAREGNAVAIVAGEDPARLSMRVLDRRVVELIHDYRAARADHEKRRAAQALINQLGSYDTDFPGGSSDIEASASREQRAALALADATAGERYSRPSLH